MNRQILQLFFFIVLPGVSYGVGPFTAIPFPPPRITVPPLEPAAVQKNLSVKNIEVSFGGPEIQTWGNTAVGSKIALVQKLGPRYTIMMMGYHYYQAPQKEPNIELLTGMSELEKNLRTGNSSSAFITINAAVSLLVEYKTVISSKAAQEILDKMKTMYMSDLSAAPPPSMELYFYYWDLSDNAWRPTLVSDKAHWEKVIGDALGRRKIFKESGGVPVSLKVQFIKFETPSWSASPKVSVHVQYILKNSETGDVLYDKTFVTQASPPSALASAMKKLVQAESTAVQNNLRDFINNLDSMVAQ